MDADEAFRVKVQRKGVITRHLKELERYEVEQDVVSAQQRLAKVKIAFNDLESAHYAHLEHIKDSSTEEKEAKWFEDVFAKYIKAVKEARAWLEEIGSGDMLPKSAVVSSTTTAGVGSSSTFSTELSALLSLPKMEIPMYSGDPCGYQNFMMIFDQCIDVKLTCPQTKLVRLLQCLAGDALSSVQHCTLAGPAGYQKARDILKERFGNAHLIVESIVSSLRGGKSMLRSHDLRKLADEVSLAFNTLTQLGELSMVDTQACIQSVLGRCHAQVRARWRKYALDYKDRSKKYPGFYELMTYLEKEARQACDPVYGLDSYRSVQSSGQKPASCYAASTDKSTCTICGNAHFIDKCARFIDMSVDERFATARRKRLCFRCLESDHMSRDCSKNWSCMYEGCNIKHHKLLHDVNKPRSDSYGSRHMESYSRPRYDQTPTKADITTGSCNAVSANVYLPILPIMVNGHRTFALLDSGSTNTFITRSLVDKAKLVTKNVQCRINTVGSCATVSNLVAFRVDVPDQDVNHQISAAFVVDQLPATLPGRRVDFNMYPSFADLPLEHLQRRDAVQVLIGMDQAELLRPRQVRYDDKHPTGIYATQTKLGWVIQGPMDIGRYGNPVVNSITLESIDNDVKNLWQLENDDCSMNSWSVEDHKVNELWESSIRQVDGHYELPIPFIDENMQFPDNHYMAEQRLKGTLKKIHKNGLMEKYTEGMNKMLQEGYAEAVPEDELHTEVGKKWYIPHHPVLSEAKPGKVRIVFDCAAKCQGVSFNNQCLQGPDLVNKLLFVLLRFRLHKYAIVADIQAMYMQVMIPVKQRDFLRFLWINDEGEIQEYRNTRHLFGGVFCAASSTYALRQTVMDFACSAIVSDCIRRAMYVDDMLKTILTVTEGRRLITEVREVLNKGGFNLTQFVVSHDELLEAVPVKDRKQAGVNMVAGTETKALGVLWQVDLDVFKYQAKLHKTEVEPVTKRHMLSFVSTLYDPLGLVSPFIVPGRLLFQAAARLKLDWDVVVPPELMTAWQTWLHSLEKISDLQFPRCVLPEAFEEGAIELHHFCDSSSQAYGACTYVRVVNSFGKVHVTLLQAKGRIAPLHTVTIPRLELCAAVMAVTMDSIIQRELGVPLLPSTYWTDSQIVQAYIKAETKRFRVFVANRVARIREASRPSQWHFIPGKMNPADVITRGAPLMSEQIELWCEGPPFLKQHKSEWIDYKESAPSMDSDPEVIPATVANTVGSVIMYDPLTKLIEHYSSFYKLCKAVAWLRRCCKSRKAQGSLHPQELKQAEKVILQHVQKEDYMEEYNKLQREEQVRRDSKIKKLDPVIVDDLIVVGGRLKHAGLSHDATHPVIVSPGHKVSRMILQEYHDNTHMGMDWVLSSVRNKFWIPHARNILRGIRRKCALCQRLYGKPMQQKMADLPPERCETEQIVFQHVGIDVFGPFLTKRGRVQVKRYGCVFTCLTTRAIHIEMLHSLESDTFINAFVRFTARRGWCKTVLSDNGTNFVGAKAELQEAYKSVNKDKLGEYALKHGVVWKFNPPFASHQGGIWERMIRTIRKVLYRLLYNVVLTDEILTTIFCEAESIVNNRPITKVTEDVMDGQPLTPNHFLISRSSQTIDLSNFTESQAHRRRWCLVQQMATAFWKRWVKQYLMELQTRSKWTETRTDLKVSDLVFIMDEQSPRSEWPLGQIEDVHLGRDGHVRSVRLRARGRSLVRPITKLVPLECK